MTSVLRALTVGVLLLVSSPAHAVYGVQEAINDALNDNLKYVGKFIPHGSESGVRPVCVYRGKKVVVYSSYCVSYPVVAAGVRIHSLDKSKGALQIYAELQSSGTNIHKSQRIRYSDYGFYVATYDTGTFNFGGSLSQMKAFDTKLALSPRPACMSTRTSPKQCLPDHQQDVQSWGEPASEFWNKPTDNWYRLIHLLKTKVP